MALRYRCLAGLLVLFVAGYLRADDGAASVAAGGIVVMKREPRVTMAKELLQISVSKVVVDYDFRNDSDQDVTTTVAFPVPAYPEGEVSMNGPAFFDDFKLWIDGAPTHYKVEARAFLNDKEYTQLLTQMKVNVATLGVDSSNNSEPSEIRRLPATQRRQLADLGLVDKDTDEALWKVQKKYYWQQTFPARKTVHIRHEYSPVAGGSSTGLFYGMTNPEGDEVLNSFCIPDLLRSAVKKIAKIEAAKTEQARTPDQNSNSYVDTGYVWVDFILTTANTWKTPIEDFTLIVERRKGPRDYVNFCWDGPVTKIDAKHFSAHVNNFVPKKELRIGWFGLNKVSDFN